jgi:threonine dehydratase
VNLPVTAEDILAAVKRTKPYINFTPIHTSHTLNALAGCELFFKCENFQKVGAFKARGAMNALLTLNAEQLAKGVATHSSGNHGQALAWAAKQLGTKATIVMPDNSPMVKKNAVAGYGADIIFCKPTLQAREETLNDFVAKHGAEVVHPYNDYHIIAGQATAAAELLAQVRGLDYVFCPVGGGGLLSGTALSAHFFSDNVQVIGCEPALADDAKRSFDAGFIIPAGQTNTIADGLRTSLGDKTFPIIQQLVSEIITVEESEIKASLRLVLERMKLVIEPSAAVGLAALLKERNRFADKKVGILLCGGNIDLQALTTLISD